MPDASANAEPGQGCPCLEVIEQCREGTRVPTNTGVRVLDSEANAEHQDLEPGTQNANVEHEPGTQNPEDRTEN